MYIVVSVEISTLELGTSFYIIWMKTEISWMKQITYFNDTLKILSQTSLAKFWSQSYYMFQVALLSGLLFGGVDGKVTFFLEMKQFSGKINFATFDHIYMLVSVIQKYF